MGLCLGFSKSANATFVVTPMEFHLKAASEETSTYSFFVRNRGDETIALKVYAGDFWIEPDGKEAFLEPGSVERSCAKWLQVSPEEFELAPGESKAIRFNISVPQDKLGTYWAMIFIEQTTKPTIKTAKKGEQQFNILSFQRVGVRIFENTPNAKLSGGRITNVNAGVSDKDKSTVVSLKFENEGDVLLKCKGTLDIKNIQGETVRTANLDEFNCYPKSSRIASASFKEKLSPGQYTALAVIDYGADYLVAGEAVFNVNILTGSIEMAPKTIPAKPQLSSVESREAKKSAPEPKALRPEEDFGKKVIKAINDFFAPIRNFWRRIMR